MSGDLKGRVLTRVYATYLSGLADNEMWGRKRGVKGIRVTDLAEVLSTPLEDIFAKLHELRAEGLIDLEVWDNTHMARVSGLGIQRLDFKERIDQMKSEAYVDAMAVIIEAQLSGVDPADTKTWKSKVAEVAKKLAYKSAEVALSTYIKATMGSGS